MATFEDTAAGMPGIKDLSPTARAGLAERALAEVVAAHRWPFLLTVQESRTWAASDAIQGFPNMARIINVMYPDSSGDYYRLTELSDIEFQKWIEMNPDSTDVSVWRDAGLDGNLYQIEIYAVPSSAKTLKIDYVRLPNYTEIDDLPARLQMLVLSKMQVVMGVKHNLAYHDELMQAIAREQDMQGKRWRVGRDAIQASRFRNINDPY